MSDSTMENLNVKIDAEDKRLFSDYTHEMGTTPSNAVRMFVRAFNEYRGFPFDTSRPYRLSAEAMQSYKEADDAIANGTARRYGTFNDIMREIDDEIAAEG